MATSQIDHPRRDDLAAFALGRLAGLRAALIERHLGSCDRCAELVADLPPDDFILRLQQASAWQSSLFATGADDELQAGYSTEKSPRLLNEHLPIEHRHAAWRIARSPAFVLPILTAVVCLLLHFLR